MQLQSLQQVVSMIQMAIIDYGRHSSLMSAPASTIITTVQMFKLVL